MRLTPRSLLRSASVGAAAVMLGLGALALYVEGAITGAALLGALVGSMYLGGVAERAGRTGGPHAKAREVAMAIVPWGVVLSGEAEGRILRWPAVRSVHVEQQHEIRGGTPAIVESIVTIETERESLVGRVQGAAGLERLVAGLERYSEEASRPVSVDLAGEEAAEEGVTEPVAALLLRRAREVATSTRGAFDLDLPTAGYRDVARATATPATVTRLRELLDEDLSHSADPRPLAALLAAVLGARELVPDLLRLTASPHPFVAASAKAAALRLGAPPNRAGSLDELSGFLFDDDHAALEAWAHPEPLAQNSGG